MFNRIGSLRAAWLLMSAAVLPQRSFAQYGTALGCHDDVNWGGVSAVGRDNTIASAVHIKFSTGYTCSGMLMNRATEQDQLGFYVSCSRHCLFGPDVNLSEDQVVIFNYQSPTANSSDTPISNRGIVYGQSAGLFSNGFEYYHKTKLRIVKEHWWGDFILLEILTPVPPHYNVYFTGWNPSPLYAEGIIIGNPPPCYASNPFSCVHHPSSDVKKISGTNVVTEITGPGVLVCDVVTTVVDVLFGWIWGNESSTQVICNYLDVPWYTVPLWCEGGAEGGSSGSGLVNVNNRYIGSLSGGWFDCRALAGSTYGKFKNFYPYGAVKTALNPSNDVWVDLVGVGGRRIQCYSNLELPGGAYSLSNHAYYFPANHYQAENRVELRAEGQIEVTAPIHILPGAHYEFKAGSSVLLNGLVDVAPGATFVAAVEGCTRSASGGTQEPDLFAGRSKLPRQMTYVPNSEQQNAWFETRYPRPVVYPNPTTGAVNIEGLSGPAPSTVLFIDPSGREHRATFHAGANGLGVEPTFPLADGMYVIRLLYDNGHRVHFNALVAR